MDDAREQLIEKAKEVCVKLGRKTITRAEFSRETGISGNQVYQHFDGWRELCEVAGLQPHTQNVRLEDDEIFSAMRDAFAQLGGITTRQRFGRAFRYSVDVFKKRGMTWEGALVAFRNWCETNAPDFPYLEELPGEVGVGISIVPLEAQPTSSWRATTGQIYGEFLNFRGLQHAPVNEQGVVFLFGMVAHELGFAVESVQTGFPDCDAKRRVGSNRWERVRVEFEYKSRNFRDHGHDHTACDVVVCWEHNWPECPIEVLELREAIKQLSR
jgi:hypothetical protein